MSDYSPLAQLEATDKEFGITPELDLPTDQKVAFVQAQIHELKQMAWREKVNILHAERLKKSDNEVMRSRGETNIVDHRNSLRQFTGAIRTLNQLKDELEAEA